MNERGGDDDPGAELSQDREDDILRGDEGGHENGTKDADGAGDQHDEQQADAEADIVVPVDSGTVGLPLFA